MKKPDEHPIEKLRLEVLDSYQIMDSLPEEDFDDLTLLATEVCKTPISLVSLIDDHRQWFKSRQGLKASETPKDYAFCAHAIVDYSDVFVIPDARKDDRFHDNPLVVEDPNVIFYAGVPLVDGSGLPLGTLCVIDHKPGNLTDSQRKALKAIANQVVRLLELRKVRLHNEEAMKELKMRNKELDQFALNAAHDIRSPLNNISELVKMIGDGGMGKEDLFQTLGMIKASSDRLRAMVDGLLKYNRNTNHNHDDKTWLDLNAFQHEMVEILGFEQEAEIIFQFEFDLMFANRTALQQVLLNLIVNAVKYNESEKPKVIVRFEQAENTYTVHVIDNGPGIPESEKSRIFELFNTASKQDRYGNQGNGIGLATVMKVVKHQGGEIWLDSELEKGSTFSFSFKKSNINSNSVQP